jgi:hypothetical protein
MRQNLKPSKNEIFAKEYAGEVLGVKGRFNNKILDTANNLFVNQTFVASRPFKERGYKAGSTITVEIRFDDNCRNGHQSFAITGHVKEPGTRDWSTGGCIHDEIAKYFPELASLIKWHLVSTDSPMHCAANAVYHASNRDYNGLLKGEASKNPVHIETRIVFGNSPISHKINKSLKEFIESKINGNKLFLPVPVEHANEPSGYQYKPKFTFMGYERKWHECPFDTLKEAEEWQQALTECQIEFVSVPTLFGEGKERDFKAARSAAAWPEATDEQLSLPADELKALLMARLPGLIAEFKADMESIGMLWREMKGDE